MTIDSSSISPQLEVRSTVERIVRDGYALIEGAFPAGQVESLRRESDRLLQACVTDPELSSRLLAWTLPGGEHYAFKLKPLFDLSPLCSSIEHNSTLSSVLGLRFGAGWRRVEDKLMLKQKVPFLPHHMLGKVLPPEVFRHTDSAYFVKRGFDRDTLSVGLLLDDCASDSGPLLVWPGSHMREALTTDDPNHGPVVGDAHAPWEAAVELTAPAGTLLFWDSRTIHASHENTSGSRRRLIVLGFDHAR